eukprot:COSAG01_NODE_3212_length_6414_cov_3.782106_6_plen_130_part_00
MQHSGSCESRPCCFDRPERFDGCNSVLPVLRDAIAAVVFVEHCTVAFYRSAAEIAAAALESEDPAAAAVSLAQRVTEAAAATPEGNLAVLGPARTLREGAAQVAGRARQDSLGVLRLAQAVLRIRCGLL